ncbi:hypothetical protein [Ancylobacter sp. FA202]|uniref:hypothetical protein n=1 Tax=Ancylobacter sp. FA202 TaxID=1111106 RepID=UPI00036F1D38|nr:hypothetical protein [Ancylobacter sp. FA202]
MNRSVGVLKSFTGTVMVDRGNGFKVAQVGMKLKAGDKISVIGEGSARFVYSGEAPLNVVSSMTATVCSRQVEAAPSTSIDPTVGVAAMLGVTAATAAVISTTQGKSTTTILPVSP